MTDETTFWDTEADGRPADPAHGSTVEWLAAIEVRIGAGLALGGHVLDLGCGPGRLLAPMATKYPGVRFYGVDRSTRALVRARDVGMPSNVQLVQGGGRSIPAGDMRFTAGWSVLTFQHLGPQTVTSYLASIAACFRPGAPFCLQVVTTGAPTPVAYGPHDFHYPLDWLETECGEAGLEVHSIVEGLLHDEFAWLVLTP